MNVNQNVIWFRIVMVILLSVCLAFRWNIPVATTSNSNKQQNDSIIVYYSYYNGEIETIFISDQEKATVRKSDILIIGETLDSKDHSQTIIDTLNDGWLKHTNYQTYTYTVKVNNVAYGVCSNDYLEITVTSSSRSEHNFSHISVNGDSVFEGIIKYSISACGQSINKRIPVGTDCIFHFKKGDISVVDYISSYSSEELRNYMIRYGLESEN